MVDGWKDKKEKGNLVAGMEYTEVRVVRGGYNPATTINVLRTPLKL